MSASPIKFPTDKDGHFVRPQSQFRSIIQRGSSEFAPEKDRYHLYACRVLAVRKLRGLEDVLPVTVVDWLLEKDGWKFNPARSNCQADPLHNATLLRDIYRKADPAYDGRVTVPVLWDKRKETIVNNESAEIMRMLYHEFDDVLPNASKYDFLPKEREEEVEAMNAWIYTGLNNGVYRAGFATSQSAYEEAAKDVGSTLKRVEKHLGEHEWMLPESKTLSEVDIRLFTTIVRFDPVYFGHFKCNLLAIKDCPNILRWLRSMYALLKDTVDMEHIKNHYYQSHRTINPTGIVPLSNGPELQ